MVTRRIRSEYMKKFKDPKWETYTKCYEEMLKYRLTRRLLEQTHKPWFWSGSDTDSDSGGRSPLPPGKNQVGPEPGGDRAEAEREECEASRMDKAAGAVSRLPLHDDEGAVDVSAANGKISYTRLKEYTGRSPCYSTVLYDSGYSGSQLPAPTEAGVPGGPQRASSRDCKQLPSHHRAQEQGTVFFQVCK